ncbi:MAG TPA: tetratricopeptide repeat protein [Acidobacteriaceae bacterium]|nr:tetratricopeptide repeat protein [Acidobacteriaceae bacterium]
MPDVLLIGWDGACWSQIHPLLDSGAMPHLARLIERGIMGSLATLTPVSPALLWTSLATGRSPDSHGVLDAFEPDERTGGVRLVTRSSLHAAHVWEILAHAGIPARSIGWPVTHPAAGPAACVSGGFAAGLAGSIFPPDLKEELAELRFDPQEWTADELRPFVPELARIDQDKDRGLARLGVLLAEAVSVQAAATALMESSPGGFSAVWFGAAAMAVEAFPAGSDPIYIDVASGVYRFLDMLLGRLVEMAGPEACVVLVSDRAAAEPTALNRMGLPRGILVAAGPGIQPDELTFGVSLLDIAPTVLALYGFQPAPGMVGRCVPEICIETPTRALVESPGPRREVASDALAVGSEVAALEALGYKDAVGDAMRPQAEEQRKRQKLNLAWVLLGQGRDREAAPLLEQLAEANPERAEIRLYLGHAYFRCGRIAEARSVYEQLGSEFPGHPLEPVVMAQLAIAEGKPEEAQAYLAAGRGRQGLDAALDGAIGELYLELGQGEEAAAAFVSAIRGDAGMATAHEGLARALLLCERFEEAAEAAMDAIRIRYDLPSAHLALGRALTALEREEDAGRAFAVAERLKRSAATA